MEHFRIYVPLIDNPEKLAQAEDDSVGEGRLRLLRQPKPSAVKVNIHDFEHEESEMINELLGKMASVVTSYVNLNHIIQVTPK